MLSIIDIIEDTTVDGPGFRTAIYLPAAQTSVRVAITLNRGISIRADLFLLKRYWKRFSQTILQT